MRKKKRTTWFLLVSMVFLSTSIVIYFLPKKFAYLKKDVKQRIHTWSAQFYLEQVVFLGNRLVTQEEMLSYLELHPEQFVWDVDLEQIRNTLLQHPFLKTVEVRRRYPHTIEVYVTEEEAKGLVSLGGLYLVNAHGDVFARTSAQDAPVFPVITGLTRELYEKQREDWNRLIFSAFDFIAAAQKAQVEVLDVRVDIDLGIEAHLTARAIPVAFGRLGYDAKLARFKQVERWMKSQNQNVAHIALNDESHPQWVVVKTAMSSR